MRWSWRIGRFFGVDVYMHMTFPLLIAAAGIYVLMHPVWPDAWAFPAMLLVLGLFGAVLLHEYGHALAARHLGIHVSHITLMPFGGLTHMQGTPDRPIDEMTVALAGPFVNLVLTFILAILGAIGLWIEAVTGAPLPGRMWFMLLFVANAMLFILNLIPVFPMDGGMVLRALIATATDSLTATTIAVMIGRVLCVMGIVISIAARDWVLMLFIFFIWHLGSQRLMADRAQAMLNSYHVRDLMRTQYTPLPSHITLSLAAQQAQLQDQIGQDFPILERGALVGMLPYEQLIDPAVIDPDSDHRVADHMKRDFPIAHPDEGVGSVIVRLQGAGLHSIPVIEADHMAGLLSVADIVEKIREHNEQVESERRGFFRRPPSSDDRA